MGATNMSEMPFAGLVRWIRHNALKVTMPRVCAALLLAIAGLVYIPYLRNPMVFDDFNVIGSMGFLDYAFDFRIGPRWLPYATLAHTYALTDGDIFVMRLGNLVLHALNAVMVFVLLREIFFATVDIDRGETERASNTLIPAMLAAVVFAAHPVAVYGAGYLVQRTALMSTMFMLLMLITYWRWLITGRRAMWVWSAVWYLLSVFSKEHSVMAPAVALFMTLLLYRPSMALARRLAVPFVAYLIIAALVISMVKGVLGAAYEPYAREMLGLPLEPDDARLRAAYLMSVITQSFLYFKYVFLWVFPNTEWMSIDLRELLATSLLSWPYGSFALVFMSYPLLALGMVLRGGRMGVAGWVLAFPWLMFATELSTIRVQEPFVLYRAYLWCPVMGALLALALYRVNPRILAAVCILVVCVLVPLSWNRLHTMSDKLLLWDDAVKLLVTGNESGAGRIFYNRALALSEKGRHADAEADLDRVIILHPKLAPVYFARAKARFDLARHAEAKLDLDSAIALNPNAASYYFARAITLTRMGRNEQATPDFQKSCELKDPVACYAMAQRHKSE